MKIVFATNNAHKLGEAQSILGEKMEVVSLREIGCTADIPETEKTLEGNSRLKAHFVADGFGVDCFADDTGLEIEALGGEPGVYSARYASLDPVRVERVSNSDAQNRAKVLRLLGDTENRSARFRTVITLLLDGQEHQFEGIVCGKIAYAERGSAGFGYDSIFIPEGYDCTFAELTAAEKNAISHRGRALEAFCQFLKTQHCL